MCQVWSIEFYHDRSNVRSNLYCVKSDRSNSIIINQTNAIGLIGCLIEWSNTLGSIRSSINPMILSWSIGLVFKINRIRLNIHCVKFDWSNIRITIDRTDALERIRYSIKPSNCVKFDRSFNCFTINFINAIWSID
jgi:hypothetical protein